MAEVYKRNQLEAAAWSVFRQGAAPEQAPDVFRTRSKHLLAIDGKRVAERGPAKAARYAFYTTGPAGRGHDTKFTLLDVYCFVIALELTDIGFKQTEAIILMRYMRPQLEAQLAKILAKEKNTKGPLPLDHDDSTFMLLSRVEIVEAWGKRKTSTPMVFGPKFAWGVKELAQELTDLGSNIRKWAVIEIAELARALPGKLAETVPTKRGPN